MLKYGMAPILLNLPAPLQTAGIPGIPAMLDRTLAFDRYGVGALSSRMKRSGRSPSKIVKSRSALIAIHHIYHEGSVSLVVLCMAECTRMLSFTQNFCMPTCEQIPQSLHFTHMKAARRRHAEMSDSAYNRLTVEVRSSSYNTALVEYLSFGTSSASKSCQNGASGELQMSRNSPMQLELLT
ncbi:hypothetical protein BJ170DRAFT_629251 [Xylariales sp. AK1849]|nr:hypothetical protein BJ170DRAFT_629251 [Xylariales sp. AK1849]